MARPNFIVINADDMALGDMAYMDNVQALLVEQGANFRQAFVTDPVCCPSRSSLLRGQYTHNHGVAKNGGEGGGYITFHMSGHEESTLATWLHDAGYVTGLYGKYMNGYPMSGDESHVPAGWDEWHAFLQGNSYHRYYINNNGVIDFRGVAAEDYSTDVLSELALEFIDQYGNGDKEFFLYINPHAPHDPSTPALRHADLFMDQTYPRNPNFNETDLSDKPAWVQAQSLLTQQVTDRIDEVHRLRLRSLQAVDEMLAALVVRLEELGLMSNTYIIFTSDNGVSQGEHRLRAKGLPYEETIRVPFVVRGPGVPVAQLEQFMLNIDVAPTIAALAGVVYPAFVDGRSLAGVIAGRTNHVETQEAFLVERLVALEGAKLTVPAYRALRTRSHLYVAYESGELELYDLIVDPYQLDSIHATADAGLLDRLKKDLDRFSACIGTTACRPRRN